MGSIPFFACNARKIIVHSEDTELFDVCGLWTVHKCSNPLACHCHCPYGSDPLKNGLHKFNMRTLLFHIFKIQ